MKLKRFLPTSLLWRTVLIVALPMVLLQVVIASLIVERQYDGVTRQMTEGVGSELRYVIEQVEEAKSFPEARAVVLRASRTLAFPISLRKDAELPPNVDPAFFDVIGRAVEDTLRSRIDRPLFVAINRAYKFVDTRTLTRYGVLRAELPRRRLVASNPHLTLTWSAGAALALMAVALAYLRNQVRPVEELAKAAEAFGKGQSVPLKIAGAQEVRQAATAFLDARDRVERHIEQRTRMLSGVSHDLRTPLTRMKLALAMMEETDEIEEMQADIREMEHMLDEFLAYARGDQGESFAETDVAELSRQVVQEARRRGGEISFQETVETPGETSLNIRPLAVKRCLHNLLGNALTYGGKASLTLVVGRRSIDFIVEDDGPGIPEDKREEAFRPFFRLDEARNQNKSAGVGLGLALALDTVRGHGGDLTLDDSEALGGLRAQVRLPR